MKSQKLNYKTTKRFSKLIEDYLSNDPNLKPFYTHELNEEGIQKAIQEKNFSKDQRRKLVQALQKQNAEVSLSKKQVNALDLLEKENTYTITTAHQTNLLLGPVYLIYKIMHAIVCAQYLNKKFPDKNFIPIYYAGSEDNDWEELDHIYINQKKYQWKTEQTKAAFGNAKIDEALLGLIQEIEDKEGKDSDTTKELWSLIKKCYRKNVTIFEANRQLILSLFHEYPLIVIDGNDKDLKRSFLPIMKEDLLNNKAEELVNLQSKNLQKLYKTQAFARPINLFYLKENIRERIDKENENYKVVNTNISWNKEELINELEAHPERFSPNVILRPVYQEFILPNIAFIGGGSELAYWMQLKKVFDFFEVPYPVLILRQSFEWIENQKLKEWEDLGLSIENLFDSIISIQRDNAKNKIPDSLNINNIKEEFKCKLQSLEEEIVQLDKTLEYSLAAVQHKINYQLSILKKKLIRAYKKEEKEYNKKVEEIIRKVFPYGGLTERKEGFIIYYNKWGNDFLNYLYKNTEPLGTKFSCLIFENKE
ncbi:MAG TPA: bacillithiol biosynthesis cysteine-adding enzyme BshC [Chitinophagaceae bacterium]|nr:bacillithiol biosynthesis cysteine-adding enzyme BshC [Chitinophagaceae bacterium]